MLYTLNLHYFIGYIYFNKKHRNLELKNIMTKLKIAIKNSIADLITQSTE